MKKSILTVLIVMVSFASLHGADKKAKPSTDAQKAEIVKLLLPGIVHIEYTLRYDKGQEPQAGGWGNYGKYIREERPLEAAGLLLSENKVLADDMMMHPLFIKSIVVRFANQKVKAKVCGFAIKQNSMFLELDKPLKGAKPLKFQVKLLLWDI